MRVSPLLPRFDNPLFVVGERAGMRIALTRHDMIKRESWLCDLSAYTKTMVIGRNADTYVVQWGLSPPPLGQYRKDDGGRWVARVGQRSYLFSNENAAVTPLAPVRSGVDESPLVLPHDLVEISLGGPWIYVVFAELIAIDFAQFNEHAWIPTLCAGIEVSVYRGGAVNEYRVLCAPADGLYLFDAFAQILREQAGEIIGLEDYETRM